MTAICAAFGFQAANRSGLPPNIALLWG